MEGIELNSNDVIITLGYMSYAHKYTPGRSYTINNQQFFIGYRSPENYVGAISYALPCTENISLGAEFDNRTFSVKNYLENIN